MDVTSKWLERAESRAILLSEAYKMELRRLWWANLMFVAVPAVLSTAAAIVAAVTLPSGLSIFFVDVPFASVFAGLTAVLISVHKALKC